MGSLIFLTAHFLDHLVTATEKQKIKWHSVMLPLILVLGMVAVAAVVQPERNVTGSVITLLAFGVVYVLFYFGKLRTILFYASLLLLLELVFFFKFQSRVITSIQLHD